MAIRRFLARTASLLILVVLCGGNFPHVSALSDSTMHSINIDSVWYDANSGSCASTTTGSATTIGPGSQIYMLGDSITVRTEPQYQKAFKDRGISAFINASVGRSWDGPGDPSQGKTQDGSYKKGSDAVVDDQAAVKAANGIVIALGSNGGLASNPIPDVIKTIRSENPTAPIWWVNVTGTSAWTSANLKSYMGKFNKALDDGASNLNYQVINWASAVYPNGDPYTSPGTSGADPNNLLADGLHPNSEGSSVLSNLVVAAVAGGGTNSGTSSGSGAGSSGAGSTTGSTACCPTGGTNLTGSDRQEKAFNFFVGKGLTPVQAAGIIGNLIQEHGLQTSDTPNGIGIAQWTGGRADALRAYAAKQGLAVTDFGLQLDFLWSELGKAYAPVLKALQQTTSVDDTNYSNNSTIQFMGTVAINISGNDPYPEDLALPRNISGYENPGIPNYKNRVNNARDILRLYGAGTVTANGSTASSSGSCGDVPNIGIGEGSLKPSSLPPYPGAAEMIRRAQQLAAESANGRTGPLYNQICGSSCLNQCDHIAAAVWNKNGLASGYCSAIVHWQSILHYDPKNAHKASDPDGNSPPVGALLFYNSGNYGHVTVYLGNNLVLSNDVKGDGGEYIVSFKDMVNGLWQLQYLGWTAPLFGTTPAWQSPLPCI